MPRADSILKQIADLGYTVSVHRMGDYVEVHAAPLDGRGLVQIARYDEDDYEGAYLAICELARMVGIELEDE